MQERFAAGYADLERWHWWFTARRAVLASLLRRRLPAAAGSGRTIVSLGSGHPAGLTWLRGLAGQGGRVVGVDADPSGALRASVVSRDGASFLFGAVEDVPLRSGVADVVLALDLIEHVERDDRAVAEAVRLLRPGGLLLVTVPALMSLWGGQDVVSGHVRRYTARTLRETFRRAGLESPETGYFNTLLFPSIAAVRWGRRIAGTTTDRSDFDGAAPGLANSVLGAIFAAERHLVGRIRLPIGVSLFALLRAPR
ncbi:MAG: class I SAM-dependent methyltransferase [Gemmatimonadetes bacterium]|nr:class I SAM-dependent methyltransferase [Gemmatimonadota bacterium]